MGHFITLTACKTPETCTLLKEEPCKTDFKKVCLQLFAEMTHDSINSELGIQEGLRALDSISDFHFRVSSLASQVSVAISTV